MDVGRDVVVVGAARTAIGAFQGAFSDVPAHQLGAAAIRAAIDRAAVAAEDVGEVVMGQVGQVGPDAYNARRCALAAGLPVHSTAQNVNRLCGSGLQAIWAGTQQVRLGICEVVVAGGNESMSRQPFLDFQGRNGQGLGDRLVLDGTLSMITDPFAGCFMGETAERVASRYAVSRDQQDEFALLSHRRAIDAWRAGRFVEETVPVERPDGVVVARDERPRDDTSASQLAALSPLFGTNGTVTAGNSSGINDGAAAVVLMTARRAGESGRPTLLRLVDAAVVGIEPEYMGYAPVRAVREVLKRASLSLDDIDCFEINEAFAAQVVAVIRDLGIDVDRVNPNGGAIALGHPIGATGAILCVKLLYELRRRKARFGLIAMCIGGGRV